MLILQIPGAEQAISAAQSRGWEAVLLVVIVLAGFTAFGLMMRKLIEDARTREDRLAQRVTQLEDVIRTQLFTVLSNNSELIGQMLAASNEMVQAARSMTTTMERFVSILDLRPCLLPSAQQQAIIRRTQRKHAEDEEAG